MEKRLWLVALVVLAMLMVVGGPALADQAHEGTVVKAGEGKLTMTDKEGKNRHTHEVPASAAITCDGKACKLEDLKEGASVKVTTKDDKTVTRVEARSAK